MMAQKILVICFYSKHTIKNGRKYHLPLHLTNCHPVLTIQKLRSQHLFIFWGIDNDSEPLPHAVVVDLLTRNSVTIDVPDTRPTSELSLCSVIIARERKVHFLLFGGLLAPLKPLKPLSRLIRLKWEYL
eukprot:m.216209 g.216209  ORF g.216209 m.216209 type:complete len:129 (+) comp39854_c0_seq11:1241-1627(+)